MFADWWVHHPRDGGREHLLPCRTAPAFFLAALVVGAAMPRVRAVMWRKGGGRAPPSGAAPPSAGGGSAAACLRQQAAGTAVSAPVVAPVTERGWRLGLPRWQKGRSHVGWGKGWLWGGGCGCPCQCEATVGGGGCHAQCERAALDGGRHGKPPPRLPHRLPRTPYYSPFPGSQCGWFYCVAGSSGVGQGVGAVLPSPPLVGFRGHVAAGRGSGRSLLVCNRQRPLALRDGARGLKIDDEIAMYKGRKGRRLGELRTHALPRCRPWTPPQDSGAPPPSPQIETPCPPGA